METFILSPLLGQTLYYLNDNPISTSQKACGEASTGNCCKICQGITSLALRLYIGALACSVPSPVWRSQARTRQTHSTTIQMKENISTSPKETRSVFVGAKVTPAQKEHIRSLAEKCGMTVSDYLLSCAYNFKPKARLTKEEAALLQNLDNCRSDLVKYTSALHGMSAKQRMILFNQLPFMTGWLGRLAPIAEGVCQFLDAVKEKNKIPSHPQSEEEE